MEIAENDNTATHFAEEDWQSALMVISLPLAIIAVAVGCQFFL